MAKTKADKDSDYVIYNSTFSLHRLSPLHVTNAQEFIASPTSLDHYARHLAEALKGDLFQSGAVAGEGQDEDTSRLGAFKRCTWSQLPATDHGNNVAVSVDGYGILDGIRIDIEYENGSYIALLLKDTQTRQSDDSTEYRLPLLFSRMTAPMRSILLDFLAVNFDTRAEALRLNSEYIDRALNDFIGDISDDDQDSVEGIIKEVQLSIGFKMPIQASLRTVDITIRREDIDGVLAYGKSKKLADDPKIRSTRGPFTLALRDYLATHLAMDLDHSHIFISRMACGAFALGREGKVKMFQPPGIEEEKTGPTSPLEKAMVKLLQSLVYAASGNG
ncbi:hypothetical protein MMC10_005070 [Thelotrema lepadinum]|nr:hypothetical protein [Thelotrema lepadinum]